MTRRKKHRKAKPDAKKPRVHMLVRGGTRLMRSGRQDLTIGPDIRAVSGGEVVYRAATYGACWQHLRRLVDLGVIPYDSCLSAMEQEYTVHPPPQCGDGVFMP